MHRTRVGRGRFVAGERDGGLMVEARPGALVAAWPRRTMRIRVTAGVGEGVTALSAFDAALQRVGAADYNLLRMSSVIPPDSIVEVGPAAAREGQKGDRAHVVYASRGSVVPGEEVWAGVGWVQQEDGWGLFAEHDGATRDHVQRAIHATLEDMCARRPGRFGAIHVVVAGGSCGGKPVCAMALAMYGSQPWDR
jgi:arginine decarboxylase